MCDKNLQWWVSSSRYTSHSQLLQKFLLLSQYKHRKVVSYNCCSLHFAFPHDICACLCLSNSYDLGQHTFFQDAPHLPLLLLILQWNLQRSPYVSYIAGPLFSSSIIFRPYLLLRSLVPEVEVTRTVTHSQSDKIHNGRRCRELVTCGNANKLKCMR